MCDFLGHAPYRGEFPRDQKCHCEYGFGVKVWAGGRASLYILTVESQFFLITFVSLENVEYSLLVSVLMFSSTAS